MKNQIFGDKKALSTVITTLIILVASVILAVSVGTFGAGIFQTSTQTESLTVANKQLFVETGTGLTNNTGAFLLTNTGEATTTIAEISIRGTALPMSAVYLYRMASGEVLSGSLGVPGADITTGTATYSIDTTLTTGTVAKTYDRADTSFSVSPRESVVIYLANPDIASTDIGGQVTITVVASRAVVATQGTASSV